MSIGVKTLDQAGTYGCTSNAHGNQIFKLSGQLDIYSKQRFLKPSKMFHNAGLEIWNLKKTFPAQPEMQTEGLSNGNYYTSVGETFTVTNVFQSTIDVSKGTVMQYVHEKDPTDEIIGDEILDKYPWLVEIVTLVTLKGHAIWQG